MKALATFTIAGRAGTSPTRAPGPAVLWGLAFAGCAAASFALAFALTNEDIGGELGEPLVIAILSDWITVS